MRSASFADVHSRTHFFLHRSMPETIAEERSESKLSEGENALALNQVPVQLHSAQQEINNLRLLNVCLQSTLFRVQSQLIEFLPENLPDESKRNETKRKLASLRPTDDHVRRKVTNQQVSFFQAFDHFKSIFEHKHQKPVHEDIRLEKHEKQIEALHEMFHELNTIIHTEHHDRIDQLYLTLAQTSHSVSQAREGSHPSFTLSVCGLMCLHF